MSAPSTYTLIVTHTHASSRTNGVAIVPTRAITVATPVAVLSLVLSRFQKRNIRFESATTKATFNSDKQRVCAANKQPQGQKHKANQ